MSCHRRSSSLGDLEPGPERIGPARRQPRKHLARELAQPRHHHVGVGVIAQAALLVAWVLLVELVRAHHPVDLITLAVRVEPGDGRPEAGDLHHHLRAVVPQERQVPGGLEVVPDVVEDGRVHMALVAAEVRLPPPGQRVEVDPLGLLLALAAALPREHRPAEARLTGRRPGLVEAPVTVHQQLARDLGDTEAQERKDIQLIPEHVAAVGLTVETPRGHSGVQVGGVPGAHLQDVADVEPQQHLNPLVAAHPHVADAPQLLPGRDMLLERLARSQAARAPRSPPWTSVSLVAASREVENVSIFSTLVGVPSRTSKASTCWT